MQQPPFPTIHIISDSVGTTAKIVARSAASHFGELDPNFVVLPYVRSFDQIRAFLEKEQESHRKLYGDDKVLVFYTLVLEDLKDQLDAYLAEHPNIYATDVLSDSIATVERMSGRPHNPNPGEQHKVNERYFERIEAIEFTIAHDDGRNPQEMTQADIVLLGVSRSSKTPTSIYLAQQGYKVSNIPLDPSTEPPKEVFEVDRSRLFGLMTTADVLVGIRQRRLGNAAVAASKYADPEYVYEDLDRARALMRKLGAIVIHTENRAVEETAQEILRYYERAHPQGADIVIRS